MANTLYHIAAALMLVGFTLMGAIIATPYVAQPLTFEQTEAALLAWVFAWCAGVICMIVAQATERKAARTGA